VLYRYADGHADRLSALAAELVSLGAMIIVTSGGSAIQAAHDSAPSVPIVSWVGSDPVMMGWVQSLARPGGMITGLFFIGVFGKRPEMLKEVRPQATTFCFLLNAANPANPQFRSGANDAARAMGVNLEIVEVKELSELGGAIDRMASLGVGGLIVTADPVFSTNPAAITKLAQQYKHRTMTGN
jgi:putative tryptophan/tyrosine transport system substrate-binding protein